MKFRRPGSHSGHGLRRRVVVIGGIAALALLAGCTTSVKVPNAAAPTNAAPPPSSPTPTATPSASPSPTPVPTSPLDGIPGGLGQQIVAVKIDNIAEARPHVGIQNADLVYVEQVEGGLTRIAALFNTSYPAKIGPVRSARISDIDILAPFNRIGFAYSGAQMPLYPLIWASPLIDVGANRGANAYTRDESRYAPHNLFANGQTLVADAAKKNPTLAHDMGWIFTKQVPAGGVNCTSVKAYWPAATAAAKWDDSVRKWVIWFDGKPEMDLAVGHPVYASTVVVQYVNQTNSQFRDHWGGVTPYIHSIGSGNAIFFRDGRRYMGKWSRPTASSPTSYTFGAKTFPFAVGPQWVFLVNKDRTVTVAPTTSSTPKPTASASPNPSNATTTHAKPKA